MATRDTAATGTGGGLQPPPSGAADTLAATGVGVRFAGVKALDGVDLALRRGEVLGLIGPNGAGKSTLVNALTGLQPLTMGSVTLRGVDVTGWPPERLAKEGLARSFQAGRLFGGLTVYENVALGAVSVGRSRSEARQLAWELLERLDMRHAAELIAHGLSHGHERMLGVLRALATGPAFLLLDEPAAGLDEKECVELVAALRRIAEEHELGLLVIEHDMSVIMRLCDRIQVLDHGKTIAIGTPVQVQRDPDVIRAYLGTATEANDA